jgi:PKD repeat protein
MNILRLLILIIVFCFKLQTSNAQTSNSISGIINRYAAVTAIDTCSGKLTVSDTTGFQVGKPILLIQMQGAEIVTSNNFLYGIIQNMNFAGRYERAVIDSVGPNAIFVQKKLVYHYSLPGKLQVVSIPQFVNAVVTDTLKCQPWNGTTGGVLAFDVAGKLTLNAPIIADGAGFRGGQAYIGAGNNCNFLIPEISYFYGIPSWRGGYKGEGIALPEVGRELGRGPQANGGGGGNDHNAGGGGGGNITDGGNGGDNDEPSAFGCDGYYPGVRGYASFFTDDRFFLGGGGGAGHSNNSLGSAGANGGGIIVISANDINGSVPIISANGLSASAANGDGAGGGGAGGTIWLSSGSAPPGIIVRANGGNGGNTINNNSNRCFGPGGGGAGGRILSNLFGIVSPVGGLTGIVTSSTNGCNGTSNGADNGEPGLVENLPDIPQGAEDYAIPEIVGSPLSDTLCPGETATFLVLANNGNWDYQWQQNDGTGWQDITGGAQFAGFQNDTLTVSNILESQDGLRFRCRVLRAGCYEVISLEANLTVNPAPAAGFTFSQNGSTVDFTNLSFATSYFWDFGDGASSIVLNPQHTYATENTFTVTLYAINDCDTTTATQTVTTLLRPTAGFTFPSPVEGCGDSVQVPFTNTSVGTATSFSWSFPGGTPTTSNQANPTVTYTTTGLYFATLITSNAAGQDTFMQIVAVTANPLPVSDFVFFVQNNGTVQFADLSQNALNLLWDFGDGTTSGDSDPLHTYTEEGTYIVTLTVWNPCDTVTFQQTLNILLPPTAGFFVQDTAFGCGSAIVEFENTSSANATSFQWNFPSGNPANSSDANPSVTYSAAGTYTAQLIVENSVGSDTVEQTFNVQIFDFPVANFSYQAFSGGVIQFTNLSQNATTYTWDFGDGYPQVPGFNIHHQYATSGVYTVTLIATSPCGVSILQQTIEVVVSGVATGEPQGLGIVRLFPNPASDWLTVDCSHATAQPVEIQIFDAGGKLVFEQNENLERVEKIEFGEIASGIYQIAVRFEKGKFTRQVIRY